MMMKRVYSDESSTSRMKSQNFPLLLAKGRHIRKVYDSFLAMPCAAFSCVVVKRNFMAKDDASRMGE